jgi:broad specificity phosphatase PhoE
MADPMTITFTAHPIETAPKDREILVYSPQYKEWHYGKWRGDHARTFWGVIKNPTHWAEIEDMRPEK